MVQRKSSKILKLARENGDDRKKTITNRNNNNDKKL